MESILSRGDALALLTKYNKEPFHIRHALTVEAVMRWFANSLGYGDEADFWAQVGLLHDIDFELYPEEHCQKAPELLREGGAGEAMIRAVCSHGYGICSDVEPIHEMEMVLFAADELTGLIGAAALMRPSKSCSDMELASLKKKFKDKNSPPDATARSSAAALSGLDGNWIRCWIARFPPCGTVKRR